MSRKAYLSPDLRVDIPTNDGNGNQSSSSSHRSNNSNGNNNNNDDNNFVMMGPPSARSAPNSPRFYQPSQPPNMPPPQRPSSGNSNSNRARALSDSQGNDTNHNHNGNSRRSDGGRYSTSSSQQISASPPQLYSNSPNQQFLSPSYQPQQFLQPPPQAQRPPPLPAQPPPNQNIYVEFLYPPAPIANDPHLHHSHHNQQPQLQQQQQQQQQQHSQHSQHSQDALLHHHHHHHHQQHQQPQHQQHQQQQHQQHHPQNPQYQHVQQHSGSPTSSPLRSPSPSPLPQNNASIFISRETNNGSSRSDRSRSLSGGRELSPLAPVKTQTHTKDGYKVGQNWDFNYYVFIFMEIILRAVNTITDFLFVLFLTIGAGTGSCVKTVFSRSPYNIYIITIFAVISFCVGLVVYGFMLYGMYRYIKRHAGRTLMDYIGELEGDYQKVACTGIRFRKFLMAVFKDAVQVTLTLITAAVLGTASAIVLASLYSSCIGIAKVISHEVVQVFCCVACPFCGGCKDDQHKGCFCRLSSSSLRLLLFLVGCVIPAAVIFANYGSFAPVSYEVVELSAWVTCVAPLTLIQYQFNQTLIPDKNSSYFGNGIYLGNSIGKHDVKLTGASLAWMLSNTTSTSPPLMYSNAEYQVGLKKTGTIVRWYNGQVKTKNGAPRFKYTESANTKFQSLDDTFLSDDVYLMFGTMAEFFTKSQVGELSDIGIECPPGSGEYSFINQGHWTEFSIEVLTVDGGICSQSP